MDNGNRSRQILRFGVFEADLETGELRKNGEKVPLQTQPFQVCAILLKRSGELVTREELRQKVWPEDTFVDFDQAVNTAIKKIRIALEDEADHPRFVETLPRRGYRFICPVLTGDGQLAEAEYPAAAAKPVVETGPIDQRLSAPPRFLVTILVSCLVVALSVIVYLGGRRMRAGPVPGSEHVMLVGI